MAKLKEITVSCGLSLERNGVWVKPNAGVTIEIDELDTPEKRKRVWDNAWSLVTDEVNKQIAEFNALMDETSSR